MTLPLYLSSVSSGLTSNYSSSSLSFPTSPHRYSASSLATTSSGGGWSLHQSGSLNKAVPGTAGGAPPPLPPKPSALLMRGRSLGGDAESVSAVMMRAETFGVNGSGVGPSEIIAVPLRQRGSIRKGLDKHSLRNSRDQDVAFSDIPTRFVAKKEVEVPNQLDSRNSNGSRSQAALPPALPPRSTTALDATAGPPSANTLEVPGRTRKHSNSKVPSTPNSSKQSTSFPPSPNQSSSNSSSSQSASNVDRLSPPLSSITGTQTPPIQYTSLSSRFNPTSQKLKARLLTSAVLGKEWGKKGKERLTEGWAAGRRNSSVLTGLVAGSNTSGTSRNPLNSSSHGNESANLLPGGIRLPCIILGVHVPNVQHQAFGIPLKLAVQRSTVKNGGTYRSRDMDEVNGDSARRWLPTVAVRCLEYLEVWARKGEEGIYRVPGSSHQIASLRALFDAGVDIDLREIHPGDLDPHTVASLFKAWLREIPESMLSSHLEEAIDLLVTESTGFSAISTQFLSAHSPQGSKLIDGRAPRLALDQLREIFGGGLPAEHYFLLRAIAFHLARLTSCSDKTKMTLGNLRLILSPTLRLSPVFLQILVEERAILFSKANESAREREGSSGPPSPMMMTPNLGTSSPTLRSGSVASTTHTSLPALPPRPAPPPFLEPIDPSQSSSGEGHPTKQSRLPSISSRSSSSESHLTTTRHPIADRFASPNLPSVSAFASPKPAYSIDNTINKGNHIRGPSASLNSITPNASILDRSRNVGSGPGPKSFTNRDESFAPADGSSTSGKPLGRKASAIETERSTRAGYVEEGSSAKRSSLGFTLPMLQLPPGLVKHDESGEDEGFGLLSFEERQKFFSA